MKFNRILAIAAGAVMVVLAASCGNDKKDNKLGTTLEEAEAIFSAELETADTTKVLEMGNLFMENMKGGKVDEALAMLYKPNDVDTISKGIRPINDEERESLRRRFERFPVVAYSLDHFDFSIPSLNDLKYSYTFMPGSETGKLNLMFNPVKYEGQWYLMLKQADQPAKDAQNALPSTAIVAMPDEESK